MTTLQMLLARTLLFEGLADEELRRVSRIAVVKAFSKGALIFSDGEAASGFYVVIDGLVKVFKLSPEGKEQTLHIFGPGEPFGEVPVFAGKPFPANAQALKQTRAAFFARRDFVDLITQNPSLALNMLAVLSLRLRQFTVQVENLSLKEVPARLAGYLLYLSDQQKHSATIQLSIAKGQLASLLGTIPETLSRIFARMSARGLIVVTGRRIRLLDRPGLEALAYEGSLLE